MCACVCAVRSRGFLKLSHCDTVMNKRLRTAISISQSPNSRLCFTLASILSNVHASRKRHDVPVCVYKRHDSPKRIARRSTKSRRSAACRHGVTLGDTSTTRGRQQQRRSPRETRNDKVFLVLQLVAAVQQNSVGRNF